MPNMGTLLVKLKAYLPPRRLAGLVTMLVLLTVRMIATIIARFAQGCTWYYQLAKTRPMIASFVGITVLVVGLLLVERSEPQPDDSHKYGIEPALLDRFDAPAESRARSVNPLPSVSSIEVVSEGSGDTAVRTADVQTPATLRLASQVANDNSRNTGVEPVSFVFEPAASDRSRRPAAVWLTGEIEEFPDESSDEATSSEIELYPLRR